MLIKKNNWFSKNSESHAAALVSPLNINNKDNNSNINIDSIYNDHNTQNHSENDSQDDNIDSIFDGDSKVNISLAKKMGLIKPLTYDNHSNVFSDNKTYDSSENIDNTNDNNKDQSLIQIDPLQSNKLFNSQPQPTNTNNNSQDVNNDCIQQNVENNTSQQQKSQLQQNDNPHIVQMPHISSSIPKK